MDGSKGNENPMSVLIVEDYDDTRKMLESAFKCKGYQVLSASGGRSAIESFDQQRKTERPVKLIVLDASMPDVTGYDVAEHVREIDKQVPILLLTGDTNPIVGAHAQYVGVNKVIYKPSDLPTIMEAAEELMDETGV
jgi:CheY-like chemotaxis protein